MPSYSRVAAREEEVEEGVELRDRVLAANTPPLPSAPPPPRSFVASQRSQTGTSSLHAAARQESNPETVRTRALERVGAGSDDIKPPSRPPPTRQFLAEQQERRDGIKPPSRPPPTKQFLAAQHYKAASSSEAVDCPYAPERFRANVGESIPTGALESIVDSMVSEARAKFYQHKYEDALVGFSHALAMAEKTTKLTQYAEYGALMHNIASCLHCLGEFDKAKEYYEKALTAFSGPRPPSLYTAPVSYMLYGNINGKRCDFVRERLVDIQFRRKPDLDKYLDGYGYKRTVTADMATPEKERRAQFPRDPMYGGW